MLVRRALLSSAWCVNATGPTTLRLLPPLTIGEAEVQEGLERLAGALGA